MTADQLAQLTDEEKRIALAKFCGWKRLGTKWEGFFKWGNPDGDINYGQKHDEFSCIPDYLNSRDAIAEVEAKLSDEQHGKFEELLYYKLYQRVCSATARQRADAILMIL